MLRRARHLAVTLTAASAIVAGTALPAAAVDVTTTSNERVLGDLRHQKIHVRLDDGEVARGDVLRFREDDPTLELRPRLAQRQVHGLQRFDQMAQQDVGHGAVAGTNGGYWIDQRSGNPNGLHVQDGRLTGSNASFRGGSPVSRSALGIGSGGGLLLDQVEVEMTFNLPSGHETGILFTNRRVHARGHTAFYTDTFGDAILVPAGGVFVRTEGLRPRSGGGTVGRVVQLRAPDIDRYFKLDPGQSAVVVHAGTPLEEDREAMKALRVGDRVSLSTRVSTTSGAGDWPKDLSGALPAGGTLLRSGGIPPMTEWYGEAFSSGHFSGRQPRTAIGRSRDGEVVLVTIDGRNKGWSVGVTGRELARTMASLGARDAVNLDGGGSTSMAKGGRIVNRQSDPTRSVASGLFLHTQTPPNARNLDSACPPGQVPSAGFDDTRGSIHAGPIDCLAWWEVTQGTSATTYEPGERVTRAQMATFLANFLDGAAERGNANGLPASASNPFDDVSSTHTHVSSIARLAEAGIVQGTSARTFHPERNVTRAQMATFILGAVEHATGNALPSGRDTFIDDNDSVHEASVDRLANIGVASGVGGFDYRPSADVRRAAMASLVMRGADFLVTEDRTTPPR